jgi:hypothetical protein
VEANTRSGPAGDNVVVHLFEWSWKDIEMECPNLGKWGYWGVQVRTYVASCASQVEWVPSTYCLLESWPVWAATTSSKLE